MPSPSERDAVTRRALLGRATYVVPAILSFAATPAFASGGSGSSGGSTWRPRRARHRWWWWWLFGDHD
jgi:hypothetical protein